MEPVGLTLRKTRAERAVSGYAVPKGSDRPTTPLYALCEQIAAVTNTTPRRWLRYGEWTLRRALADLSDKPGVRNRAAMLTWLVKKYR